MIYSPPSRSLAIPSKIMLHPDRFPKAIVSVNDKLVKVKPDVKLNDMNDDVKYDEDKDYVRLGANRSF